MKILIFIIISAMIILTIINNLLLKEHLDLNSYTNIYVNSIEKATKGLTDIAITQCNQANTNYNNLQTTVTNYINTINVTNINNIQNSINNNINSVNNIVNTPITTYKLGAVSYYNPDLYNAEKLVGGLTTGVLNNINITLTNSSTSTVVNPYIQFIIKNYDNIEWVSKLIYLTNVTTLNYTVTQGDSNASVSSYSVTFPIVIANNTALNIILSKNVYITNVVISANYQTTENTTLTLYDIQRYINTSATYQTSLINHFNYNKALTGTTFNLNEVTTSKIDSSQSLLITKLLTITDTQNTLLNQSVNYYNNTNTQLTKFINIINGISTDFTTFNNYLSTVNTNKQTLLEYINQINAQITTLSSYITTAQNVVINTTNYNDSTAIKNSLGSIYTSAQTDVDNALTAKNKAQSDLDNAIKNNLDATTIKNLRNILISATETYIQTYENLRFLLDPNNLVVDDSNTTEVTNLNINLNKGKLVNIFLKYLTDNNIDIQNTKIFINLLNNTQSGIDNINNINNKLIITFKDAINNIIKNRNTTANNALNVCTTTNTNLNSLLLQVQSNLTTINNIINNSNINSANINTFLTNINAKITDFKNILTSINTQNTSVILYKTEVLTNYNTYSTSTSNDITIGTIKNTGQLVKLYYFANLYSWQTCIDEYTSFTFTIKSVNGTIKYNKTYRLTVSPYMTIEFFQSVNISVITGDIITVNISGSYIFCSVEVSNILCKLDIQTA